MLYVKRKEQILAAAASIFAAKGYFAAGVDDIIQKAEIARGTFYLYFKNKRQAFTEVLSGIMADIADHLRRVDLGEGAPPVEEQFRNNIRRVFQYFIDNPSLARILVSQAAGLDEESDEHLDQGIHLMKAAIRSYLEEGQQRGYLRGFNAEAYSYLIVGGLKEALAQLVVYGNLDVSLDELIDSIVQYNCFGLLKPTVSIG